MLFLDSVRRGHLESSSGVEANQPLTDGNYVHPFGRRAEFRQRAVAGRRPYGDDTRQSRWDACSTILAHMNKDGLMFIHPTQSRSLTPREAARVQTFPDWFEFPVTRMYQFKLIGNAVPPLVSEGVVNPVLN